MAVAATPAAAAAPCAAGSVRQPTAPITGIVVDEKGQPLPGVTIVVKGTTAGAAPGRRPGDSATWNWPTGSQLRITAYTTNEATELLLNGQSPGRKTGPLPTWDVPYAAGELSARGYRGGQVVSATKVSTAGPATALQLAPDRRTLGAARGVAQVEITIVDAAGRPVPTADHESSVTLSDPARLLGLENGDLANHEAGAAPRHHAQQGRLPAYVQATSAGAINLSVSAPACKAARWRWRLSSEAAVAPWVAALWHPVATNDCVYL